MCEDREQNAHASATDHSSYVRVRASFRNGNTEALYFIFPSECVRVVLVVPVLASRLIEN